MNHAQRLLVIAVLIAIGFTLAFIFLDLGYGAYTIAGSGQIAILTLSSDATSQFRNGYGLYTQLGIPGVLLGLITPICLFAAAAFVALAPKAKA